jgi:hypothetical protein
VDKLGLSVLLKAVSDREFCIFLGGWPQGANRYFDAHFLEGDESGTVQYLRRNFRCLAQMWEYGSKTSKTANMT